MKKLTVFIAALVTIAALAFGLLLPQAWSYLQDSRLGNDEELDSGSISLAYSASIDIAEKLMLAGSDTSRISLDKGRIRTRNEVLDIIEDMMSPDIIAINSVEKCEPFLAVGADADNSAIMWKCRLRDNSSYSVPCSSLTFIVDDATGLILSADFELIYESPAFSSGSLYADEFVSFIEADFPDILCEYYGFAQADTEFATAADSTVLRKLIHFSGNYPEDGSEAAVSTDAEIFTINAALSCTVTLEQYSDDTGCYIKFN